MIKKSVSTPCVQKNSRLSAERYRRGWSQQEVADLVGTTPLNVSRWERGLTKPSPYFRHKLCELFGLSASLLGIMPEEPDKRTEEKIMAEQGETARAVLYDPTIPFLMATAPLVGREEELKQLKSELLAASSLPLVALSGLPGVGKTALALTLAQDEQIRQQFSNGILWASLGPEANVSEVWRRWGSMLGLKLEPELTTPEAWGSALRAAVGQRRFLIVLDDVWQLEDALQCMIGGAQCGYVLTTRFPQVALGFAAEKVLALPELDDAMSFHLIQTLAPAAVEYAPEQVKTLVRASGGLPLALSLMGSYLCMRAHNGQPRRIRAALAQLCKPQVRLRLSGSHLRWDSSERLSGRPPSLEAVIALSHQRLPEPAQRALCALSVLPAKPETFSEEAALAVCGESGEVLDALSDAGLLESIVPGRYALHPVIADYARLHLSETEPVERLMVYSRHYIERCASHDEALAQECALLVATLQAAYEQEKRSGQGQDASFASCLPQAEELHSLIEEHLHKAYRGAKMPTQRRKLAQALEQLQTIAAEQKLYEQKDA